MYEHKELMIVWKYDEDDEDKDVDDKQSQR